MRASPIFPPGTGPAMCRLCGRFSCWDGEGCLYCDPDGDDDIFSWEDWEASSPEEEAEDKEKAPPRDSPATFCGFKKSFLCSAGAPGAPPPTSRSQDCPPLPRFLLPRRQQLTAEEAERNAEELVAEEERAKKKAEKKRLKKKRQKDRKRQEKRSQESEAKGPAGAAEASGRKPGVPSAEEPDVPRPRPPEPEGRAPRGSSQSLSSPGCSTEEELEEELDLSSTFVSKARLKVSTKSPQRKEKVEKGKAAQPERTEPSEAPKADLRKSPVEQSMVLADCGNETAQRGCYREAVLLFTEAVKLNPQEYRFFGNRSFCFEKLQCYPEALRDAQLALRLRPGWPKGLFRQGKALMGLQQYADAARTFEELLRIDGFQDDAATQLRRCHLHLLLNRLAPTATPLPAWNGLAQGTRLPLQDGRPLASCSSPQGGASLPSVTFTWLKPPLSAAQAPVREWFAVWVGNLTPKVTQEALLRYFQPFGPIDSIRCLPQKFCAFVNYTRQDAAEAAFRALQGVEVEGRRLQLQLRPPLPAAPPPAKKAPHSSGQQQPPVQKREPAPPQPNSHRAKGGRSLCGPLPQRGASAKALKQQL